MPRARSRQILRAAVLATLLAPIAGHAAAPAAPQTAWDLAAQTAARLGTTLVPDASPPLSSDNVELVTTMPGSFAGIRVVGKTAYATGWDGLTIFDVSTPTAPKLLSVLPIAHFENEDVESDGQIVLISNDREKGNRGGVLFVVDVRDPAAPAVASVLSLSQLTSDERGPGHIANCVADGCGWVWLTGGARVWVVDLHDIYNPLLVRAFDTPVSAGSAGFGTPGKIGTGATHDVERDAQGRLFVTGSGGAAAYDAKDPVHPRLLSTTGAQGSDAKVNDFILHNSKHPSARSYRAHPGRTVKPSDVLLVTEEDYVDTGETPPGGCRGQGKFQTWNLNGYDRGKPMTLLSQWQTEVGETPFLDGNKAPVTANCSSHWFTERAGIVADAWYEQGARFLDVRDPRNIRQIGYWLPPNAVVWGAYWVTDEIVYTADVVRGIDVLKVAKPKRGTTAPTVVAPIRAGWLGAGAPSLTFLRPSATWGYACPVPEARVS